MKSNPGRTDWSAAAAQAENAVGLRILSARKEAGLTLAGLSERLRRFGVCVTAQAVSKWESGKSTPSAYQLLALCRALSLGGPDAFFPAELDAAGCRKLEQYRQDLIASGRYEPVRERETELIEMPVFDRPASAGTGSFLDGDSFHKESFPAETVPEGADFAVRVTGDSMTPYFLPGQLVWVRQCRQLRPREVGIFVVDGESYIKQYTEQLPEDSEGYTDSAGVLHPQTVLVSYNSAYAPRVITPEMNCTVIGKVLR